MIYYNSSHGNSHCHHPSCNNNRVMVTRVLVVTITTALYLVCIYKKFIYII